MLKGNKLIKRISLLIIMIIMISFTTGCIKDGEFTIDLSGGSIFSTTSELTEIIETLPLTGGMAEYKGPNFYFMYEDQLYYYDYKTHELFVANLDGTNKRLITQSEELLNASFFLVYKGEAYFYNTEGYHEQSKIKYNKKVNLKTGKITNLNNDYAFIPSTLKNNIITAVDCRTVHKTCHYTYVKYNLDTNKVEYENKSKEIIGLNMEYNDQTGDTYYIKDKKDFKTQTATFTVTKGDKLLGEFTLTDMYVNKYSKIMEKILYINDYFIILTDKKKIYKYNFATKELIVTPNVHLESYGILSSNNKEKIYIYNKNDDYLYELDLLNATLIKVFKYPGIGGSFIYDSYSKLYVLVDANTLKYKTSIDSIGKMLIYDKETRTIETKPNIRRAFIDYENKKLYTYTKENNNYYATKYSLTR